MKVLLLTLALGAALLAPAVASACPGHEVTGKMYFVSPTGSDANAGTSPATAWRTVAKVNSAALNAGDAVMFKGGATFSDAQLAPSRSGTATLRITYATYGPGKASLPQGIYLRSVSGLAFENLSISGPSQGILASGSGTSVSNITIDGVAISSVGIGINSALASNSNWTIRNSTVSQTGDSGLILLGSNFSVTGNRITDTGTNTNITYGKHGIYLKVSDATVTGNTIERFHTDGVSVRYRNSRVESNTISTGSIGISWYQQDPTAGTSYWRTNTISGTTHAGMYVSPSDSAGSTKESFVITGNKFTFTSGVCMNLHPTTGTYTVNSNTCN
ncbi:MAG: right-handed parallel beta-helix repeat-containing protein [Actinomycetota bacterium]|nr:right-handed parallel beta-helix repeat-containing protein [Actinomycetota bacterium]